MANDIANQVTASVARFNEVVRRSVKVNEKNFATVQRKVALTALQHVVMATPVDTGRARGNWQTTISRLPVTALNFGGQMSKGDESIREANKAAATQKAVNEGTNMILSTNDPFVILYLTNNVHYIKRLEEGSSKKQAPHGMVRKTLKRLERMFK